ncbi:hypothetical protein BLS_005109 [Venturia inaequalis]|uniref:Cap binding protein n=1 Tax=Venturia inaequalis TaxID=5025 RepID=A0A8H3UID8_VENIN|nr:hypothetical protein BLS_005109 [Venturia inaequalis]KAE9978264.1 hypothetical protein EG327_007461 [Venturia inaequalis]KAE9978295.1 hypothetical protein EG328_001544 [Venturia inaequalis]RDI86544.1 hypothetical protein Vi05172_g3372 [Venturia inaequalis]
MASTEVEPRMADNMPASLANARILDEIMNDGDEEAVRQLEIDIHEEVAKAPTQPRVYLQPRSRYGGRIANRGRNTGAANNTEASIYPDYYKGPGPTKELEVDHLEKIMADVGLDRSPPRNERNHERRHQGNNNRKRRFREDDDFEGRDQRPQRVQRPRYEEPIASRLRRELMVIGEAPIRTPQDEAAGLGRDIANNFDDDQIRGPFLDNFVQLLVEQPLKIPFVAAVVLYAHDLNAEASKGIIEKVGKHTQTALLEGKWREFKLFLRFFACLQPIMDNDGVFPVLDQLFGWAADLQAASQEDAVGLELVKIILLTIPYSLAMSASGMEQKVNELLEQTEIIASARHPLETLVDPFPGETEEKPFGFQSFIELLQSQLQREETNGWKLSCIPRIYKPVKVETAEGEEEKPEKIKHALPALTIPAPVNFARLPLFPETYFSIYADQETEVRYSMFGAGEGTTNGLQSVPSTADVASSLIRDVLVDTINVLDFNRIATASFLIQMDIFWAPGTFATRGISFEQLKNFPADRSTWKPEDVVLDAIFSQMLLLPTASHKLVYYHSLITEACKIAPSHIAPTLGRGIRFLFRHLDVMDMELTYRYLDWFAHHLSNFEFRWKWTEWIEDVKKSELTPKKAFIIAALDKEIRLSFAKRIRETLPQEYHHIITEGKFKDVPDYKYNSDQTPYSAQGREILALLKKKAPETEIQPLIDAINEQAAEHGITDPLVASTDAYMTAVCFIGSKSLSHVLSCIERCKERLLNIGPQSEGARRQIVKSVVEYWKDQPGTAVNIVDKLLNYTIVTPESVILWALGSESLGNGSALAEGWRYEMISVTIGKVTNRVRQIVQARVQAVAGGLPDDQIKMLEDTLEKERHAMRQLFANIEDSVGGIAQGASDSFIEAEGSIGFGEKEAKLVKIWGERWGRVFRRKLAVEEAVVGETAVEAQLVGAREAHERAVEAARIAAEEAEAARLEAEKAAAEKAAAEEANGNGTVSEVNMDEDTIE